MLLTLFLEMANMFDNIEILYITLRFSIISRYYIYIIYNGGNRNN
jgi:hypothetical protein